MSRSTATYTLLSVLVVLYVAAFANAATVTYTYDNAGRLVKTDYGDGKTIEYKYDAAGNLLEKKITELTTPQNAISPDQGTIGTRLTITGSGFGGKKGKVLIGKKACIIQTWADEAIVAVLKVKLPPQHYDVKILPKEPKKAAPILLKEAFRVMAPGIDSIEPGTGPAKAEVTVQGSQFGTVKGKVFLEYARGQKKRKASCKVLTWEMDPLSGQSKLVFVVPKGIPNGTVCDLTVANQVGSTTKAAGFMVQ